MLKDITLGQFFPGDTLVHRLDPRTKLIFVLLYIVALFQAKGWVGYGLVLLVTALCMAMSFVLSYIKLYSMPLGGSVTLASMLPLLWYSNKFGVRNGLIAGAAYGLLQLIQKPEIYHWVQVLLDYPLAFMMLGLAGSVKNLQLGSVIGVAGRWICHILSGAIFFAEWVPEGWSNAWVYSAAYNGAYLLVDLIICIVLSFVLAKALDKIPTGRK